MAAIASIISWQFSASARTLAAASIALSFFGPASLFVFGVVEVLTASGAGAALSAFAAESGAWSAPSASGSTAAGFWPAATRL